MFSDCYSRPWQRYGPSTYSACIAVNARSVTSLTFLPPWNGMSFIRHIIIKTHHYAVAQCCRQIQPYSHPGVKLTSWCFFSCAAQLLLDLGLPKLMTFPSFSLRIRWCNFPKNIAIGGLRTGFWRACLGVFDSNFCKSVKKGKMVLSMCCLFRRDASLAMQQHQI